MHTYVFQVVSPLLSMHALMATFTNSSNIWLHLRSAVFFYCTWCPCPCCQLLKSNLLSHVNPKWSDGFILKLCLIQACSNKQTQIKNSVHDTVIKPSHRCQIGPDRLISVNGQVRTMVYNICTATCGLR